jgi:hypothetical protein
LTSFSRFINHRRRARNSKFATENSVTVGMKASFKR